jgi:soluble lytic murein transglycosylase-like protein
LIRKLERIVVASRRADNPVRRHGFGSNRQYFECAACGSGTSLLARRAQFESAAAANGLPFVFFARVMWQESRFRPDSVGPLTRSSHKAEGTAQFMPMTAVERLLRDPFDPAQALPKSAEFLRDLA